jgi:hypothetical protein
MNQAENTHGCRAPDCGELDWLAFQYVAGEFTADESANFEQQLATDQSAREAVARAVELCESTAVAFGLSSVSSAASAKRNRLRPAIFAACGIAAALAILVTLAGLTQRWLGMNSNGHQIADRHGEVRELAMAWATARAVPSETADVVEETDGGLSGDIPTVDSSAVELAAIDSDEVESIETPSWMLIAVAGLSENGSSSVDQNEKVLE